MSKINIFRRKILKCIFESCRATSVGYGITMVVFGHSFLTKIYGLWAFFEFFFFFRINDFNPVCLDSTYVQIFSPIMEQPILMETWFFKTFMFKKYYSNKYISIVVFIIICSRIWKDK